tara:strand:- start:621 stop:827 length:207 start_codon:yes stop_codon:yes gene_type:complete
MLPKDLRTAPGARRIIIKINKKDPTRAMSRGITKDFPERRKTGTPTNNERNKYVIKTGERMSKLFIFT